ncbi:MAG TPA: DNA polymerase IV [Salinivirga sp.]|uniref:DNA polymerase IV n=1 Tax=Salinivirga sp. TaxID=1970192 RepID=UPI002B47BBD3|nr:DNA polymerase IV [Salinivirga sp.]HKK60672.1 DNA polymerase IV [Salinivirga sp.]
MNTRNILHLDLDTFFVSVERLRNSALNNKPIIIGGTSDRGVVSACSYETRPFGVYSGMPMKMARRLCPEALQIRGDMDQYSKYSHVVTDIIAEEAPLYEKMSIDEHYLDLTGMDRFFGTLKWSRELRQRIIKESGLPISFGLSTNKSVAKIATGEAKPNGELQVAQQQVLPFLSPLSIRKIPGVGHKAFQTLRTMGVDTIETLRMVPPEMVTRVLGKNGKGVWKKANGIDPTPVKPYRERKSIGTERTFSEDRTDTARLEEIIAAMTEKLAFELRQKQKVTACVTVKIRYANFDTHTKQQRIPYSGLDHQLIKVARELFRKVYDRRMRVRLIGVKFSHLVHGAHQLNLFEDTSEMVKLYQALDSLRNRYGSHIVHKALAMKRL